jgi:NTP pyrophosphatase (non-canonical NTP hydrolase)
MEKTMNEKTKEILDITAEECAEVIVAISKISRFGIDKFKPMTIKPLTNRQHLEEEIGDLLAMVDLLEEFSIVDMKSVNTARIAKIEKLKQWSNIFKAE